MTNPVVKPGELVRFELLAGGRDVEKCYDSEVVFNVGNITKPVEYGMAAQFQLPSVQNLQEFLPGELVSSFNEVGAVDVPLNGTYRCVDDKGNETYSLEARKTFLLVKEELFQSRSELNPEIKKVETTLQSVPEIEDNGVVVVGAADAGTEISFSAVLDKTEGRSFSWFVSTQSDAADFPSISGADSGILKVSAKKGFTSYTLL